MIRILIISLFIISAFAGCERIPRDYAGVTTPKDSPKYQVQVDPHDSTKRN